jgi:hypothetical protein
MNCICMFIDFREFSPAKSPAPAHNRRLSDRPHGRQQRPKPVPCGQRTWLQPGGELPETPQKIDKYFLNIFWPRSGHPIPSLHHPIPSHPISSHPIPSPAHPSPYRQPAGEQNLPEHTSDLGYIIATAYMPRTDHPCSSSAVRGSQRSIFASLVFGVGENLSHNLIPRIVDADAC